MDEEELHNAFLSLIGLALFFSFATIGVIIASLDPDSYLYIDFEPDTDLLFIILFIILDDAFFIYYLIKISIFKKSSDLNYRKRELLIFSDKLKISCLLFVPIQLFQIYFLLNPLMRLVDLNIQEF